MMNNIENYEQFAQQMEQSFPKMFAEPYGGFAIGDGWYPIIQSLCANIQSHINWKQEQKEKYQRGEGCSQVIVSQIKEKFGGLRFYYDGGDEQIHGMVRMAESWADATCEMCSKPGTSRSGGWIKTLCDEHDAERKERYKKEYGTKV